MKTSTLHFLVGTALTFDAASAVDSDIFNYDPNSPKGPEFWKDIALENNQCGGTSNSPIALESMPCTMFEDYKFESGTCTYNDYGFDINDHVSGAYRPVNASCTAATMEVPGVEGVFELLQFHLHMNSEHTIGDIRYGAELHMVHQLKDSDPVRLAVMGVFIEASSFEDQRLFDNILAGFDAVADRTALACNLSAPVHWWTSENRTVTGSPNSQLQIYDLIPEGSTFYNYNGSLTTPPCSEIVEWNVASKPLAISVAQYNDLTGLVLNYVEPETCKPDTIASPSGSTSRPVQDLNAREINHICPKGYQDPLAGESEGNSTSGAPRFLTVGARSAAVAGALAAATALAL